MGDDRHALVHVGAQAARVVEVGVGADHVRDRPPWEQGFHLGDDGFGARLGQRRLDHHDAAGLLDHHAVVRGAGDELHPGRELRGLDGRHHRHGVGGDLGRHREGPSPC